MLAAQGRLSSPFCMVQGLFPMWRSAAVVLGACVCLCTHAAELRVAVAANFAAPMKKLAAAFEQSSGHTVLVSVGATGQFYAQIKNGAPFQLFLSADSTTPERLEREGLAVPGSRWTYAVGRLALWSRQPDGVDERGEVLRTARYDRLALADPKLAPYGAAAVQALQALGVWAQWAPKVVQGENIAQAYQFVASGNAPLGFVALSQIYVDGKLSQGSAWIVPEHLYAPLRQDAVVLKPGANQPAVDALVRYLRSPAAQTVVRAYGYGV